MSDINKLPKWAQHEITRLRSDVKYYKDKIDQICDVDAEAKVYWGEIGDSKKHGIPEDEYVFFIIKKGVKINLRLDKDDESILIGTPNGVFSILPLSTNLIKMTVL